LSRDYIGFIKIKFVHDFYFGGQLAVVKQGAVHTYLSQLQLIPGRCLNALGWPKPSVLYRNEEGQ